MVKQNKKRKLVLLKYNQYDGSDKKEIRKRGSYWNIIIVLVKWNEKCKLLLLKCSLMVETKRNQEKMVVTKICFYGKKNEKWKLVLLKYNLMVMTERKLEKEVNVTNTMMYLPQVYWGVNQTLIWSQLTVCWV